MNTNEIQLKALRESRDHWFRLKVYWRRGSEMPIGPQCACCKLADDDCGGCPIHEYTRRALCEETPYYKAFGSWYRNSSRAQWEAAAQEEIDFIDRVIAWVEAGKSTKDNNDSN